MLAKLHHLPYYTSIISVEKEKIDFKWLQKQNPPGEYKLILLHSSVTNWLCIYNYCWDACIAQTSLMGQQTMILHESGLWDYTTALGNDIHRLNINSKHAGRLGHDILRAHFSSLWCVPSFKGPPRSEAGDAISWAMQRPYSWERRGSRTQSEGGHSESLYKWNIQEWTRVRVLKCTHIPVPGPRWSSQLWILLPATMVEIARQ